MTTREIADRLVSLCQAGENLTAFNELYSADVVNLEAFAPGEETKGLDNVIAKSNTWRENHEIHSAKVEGPFVFGDEFAVRFTYEITPKATGKRVTMDEVGVYAVKDGKIVHEKFMY